jgi:hypothetical protein
VKRTRHHPHAPIAKVRCSRVEHGVEHRELVLGPDPTVHDRQMTAPKREVVDLLEQQEVDDRPALGFGQRLICQRVQFDQERVAPVIDGGHREFLPMTETRFVPSVEAGSHASSHTPEFGRDDN